MSSCTYIDPPQYHMSIDKFVMRLSAPAMSGCICFFIIHKVSRNRLLICCYSTINLLWCCLKILPIFWQIVCTYTKISSQIHLSRPWYAIISEQLSTTCLWRSQELNEDIDSYFFQVTLQILVAVCGGLL